MDEVVAGTATAEQTPTAGRLGPAEVMALISYAAVALVLAVFVGLLVQSRNQALGFDDAFMFHRYAMNMRHGLGMSWNLDGVHTYGETAPLWGFVVYGLSYLPLNASQALQLGSWLSSVAAFAGMAWAVSSNARSVWMGGFWRVAGAVALPLGIAENYRATALTGMETMLAMGLCAVFVGAVLRWSRGEGRAEVAGLAGLLLFLTRPESAMLVLLLPGTMVLLMRRQNLEGLARLLGVFLGGVAIELVFAKRYFGTALPLSFYMKSAHGYEGYARYWHPTVALLAWVATVVPFLWLLAVTGRRADWRMLAAFAVPLVALVIYLDRVLQIMNTFARYYLPYTPLIVVPALLILDRRLSEGRRGTWTWQGLSWGNRALRLAGGSALLLLLVPTLRVKAAVAVDRRTEPAQYAYEPVVLRTDDGRPLPEHTMVELWATVPRLLFADLPRGATIASSEVGYVGVSAAQANVIDLAGLNDREIALAGFDVTRFLARKPDVIWLPHPDYTWQRGVLLSDARFLKNYEVIAGAAASGIAIRKDGPYRTLLEAKMEKLWDVLYPGIAMKGYVVQSATWSDRKHRLEDVGE